MFFLKKNVFYPYVSSQQISLFYLGTNSVWKNPSTFAFSYIYGIKIMFTIYSMSLIISVIHIWPHFLIIYLEIISWSIVAANVDVIYFVVRMLMGNKYHFAWESNYNFICYRYIQIQIVVWQITATIGKITWEITADKDRR